jgi:hydrogenase-4 transcriptional activator
MQADKPAARAFRSGRLSEAFRLLGRGNRDSTDDVMYCELLYLLGHSVRAASAAVAMLVKPAVTQAHRARYLAVLAAHQADEGRLEEAVASGRQALAAATQAGDPALASITAALLLERSCDRSGFDASLPLAAQTRRAAARCADPQIKAFVHLTFGRLEGRVGHLQTALRHFAISRELLTADQNGWLASSLDLDESSVLFLMGDSVGALALAERGSVSANECGWAKGKLVAAVNLAHQLMSLGRTSEAEALLGLAREQSFHSITTDVALAEIRAQVALSRGLCDEALAILIEAERVSDGVPCWYALANQTTHIRVLFRLGHWQEAVDRASNCLAAAKEAGAEQLFAAFSLLRAEALIGLGRSDENEFPTFDRLVGWPLSLIGTHYLVTAKALLASGEIGRGLSSLERARRVLRYAGNKPAEIEAQFTADRVQGPTDTVLDEIKLHSLDSAVALLELSGHPHILAREAFAILQETGCVEAVALVGTGTRAPRIIDAHGWTSGDARAALRAATQDHLIPVGQHRDETWQILVRPRPELDHRCTLAALRKLVATAGILDQYRRDEKQRAALWPVEALDSDPESLWVSEQSVELVTLARRIASTPLPILLTGETGTGKEMLARIIHRASDRADKPLQPFNCTAVPRDMLESQLFGYRKGAFTGADTSFAGVIRAAAGGTLFLDEIGEIGMDLQPKLLRFLEYKEVHPLGEPHPIKVDVRIIAATNANIEQLVAQGRFREDLFYRLNGLRLPLPPLRERREEIPPLVHHYMRKFGDEQRKGRLTLSDETLEYLLLYNWPGNIRQLANEVRRMIALAEPDSTLTPALLSPEIQASRRTIQADTGTNDAEVRVRLDQPLPDAVEMLEQTLVRRALERSHGRVEEAARLLGISRKGLFLKRRRWGGVSRAS